MCGGQGEQTRNSCLCEKPVDGKKSAVVEEEPAKAYRRKALRGKAMRVQKMMMRVSERRKRRQRAAQRVERLGWGHDWAAAVWCRHKVDKAKSGQMRPVSGSQGMKRMDNRELTEIKVSNIH